MPQDPEVSVIIASYNARGTIGACLQSLEEQTTLRSFEVIVVDSSTDGTGEFVEEMFPHVRVHRFSERKFAGDARNIGIAAARGKIIAFTDADCQAEQDWITEILKAHASPWLAIGGAIANANPKGSVSWAAYFCEFSQWMPGTGTKWLVDIAGANMSYKRAVFERYGSFIEGTYCSDTDLHWRLGRDGLRLRFMPSIRVSHNSIDKLQDFLGHELFHGLCFGRVRIQGQQLSIWKRWLYVILAPFIPLKLFLTVLAKNLQNKTHLVEFLRSSPLVALGLISWSLGEVIAYAGRSSGSQERT